MSSILRSLVANRLKSVLPLRSLATVAETATAPAAESSTPPEAEASSSVPTPDTTTWSPYTQRIGLIAKKRGMTALWDQNGKRWPVTVLQIDDCQVVHTEVCAAKTASKYVMQVGSTNRDPGLVNAYMLGHFRKNNVTPKHRLRSFRVTEDAQLPVGTTLSAAHFVPGQHVDVTAKSIGKGFQGVMKRHGFAGLPATHGTSVKHRSGGAIGANQDPGRVWKGKKMPGRMGGKQITTQNLLVHRVDTALNLIYVRGAVPGFDDQYIYVRDAVKKIAWRSNKAFLQGKSSEEWIGDGVASLPMPAGTKENVKAAGWAEVLEWPGLPQEAK